MTKFEQLVEFIINEDEEKAQELFHEIVVEKSREIYNDLVNEDIDEDQTDDFVSDIEADEEGMDVNVEEDDDEDDMEADMDDEDMEADHEEMEDRIVDLESALDDLKAEFDAMQDMEPEAPEAPEMDAMDADDEMEEDFAFESDDSEADEEEEIVREYTEKVAAPVGGSDDNANSTVAGKNDMGGTAGNIAQGGDEAGGKVAAPKTNDAGNKNKPGAKQNLEKAPAPKKGE